MAEKQSTAVPLKPPHRPIQRRLQERWAIDPESKSKDMSIPPPLHSDTVGTLALSEAASTYHDQLEGEGYL